MVFTVTQGGSSFAEQCIVIKWLEEAGVDFFDISGGVYTDPAWKGDMPEIAERPIRRARGRLVSGLSFLTTLLQYLLTDQLFHRMGTGNEESLGKFFLHHKNGRQCLTSF